MLKTVPHAGTADLVGCLVGKVLPRRDAEPDDLYPTARAANVRICRIDDMHRARLS